VMKVDARVYVISVGTRIEANTRLCNRLYHQWGTVSLSGVGVVMGVRDNTRLGGEVCGRVCDDVMTDGAVPLTCAQRG